jgi:hypothetical protein
MQHLSLYSKPACSISASALRDAGRDEEGKIALRRVGELHTNSIELDRKMHKSMVGGAR